MKKKLYFIFALLILIIVLIVSCNKINILGANYIPPETDFKLPEEAIPGHIDVNPVPAKYGEVFGGFSKKFKYKDKWYILADYMYDYDPERKKLNKTDKNIILEIDDNANINVYAKNVDYDIFDRLKYNISVIENDRVIYEPSSYGKYSISNISPSSGKIIHSIVYDNIYYTSSDLINWQTNGSDNNIRYKMPYPNPFNFDESFQGGYGTYVSRFFQFKDYIYLIGLVETFYEQNPSGTRPIESGSFTISKDYYYRIHKSKDTSVGANWEKIDNTPWGARSTKFVIGDFDVKIDKDKIYFSKGYREYYEYSPSDNKWAIKYESFRHDSRIWSSTDGVNWNLEYDEYAFYKATNVYDSDFKGLDRYLQNRIRTPEEPNWVKLDNGIYYKSDNTYSSQELNGKIYYYPTVPYAEIDAAYNRGEEYFTVSQKHLKGAGKNQFFAAREKPNEGDSWKLITPIDYTDDLMVWQSGGEKVLLNINNKVIQFIDYYQIELMIKSPPIESYSTLVNYFRDCEKKYREGFYDPVLGYFVTSIREAMYYGAKADMTEAFMKNYKEYIMPDESLTHYTVEFKY
ncbi:hypothetical protein NEI00_01520 [Brachyspira pilosicoli]|uniref:hypothetical protein n=1 Tax=Brachyspira pilosicoli TaxID=52584 RepID=UPI002542917B|nr:hypothetical protein [Brachyspira pilosicoli]WIH83874.1 hypothetical protein NEI00_01520 [Brachyspira pilosicoli]